MSILSQPISIIPIQPIRKIGEINVNVVINENTNDTLSITKQPVQQGASITDHSYLEPTTFSTTIMFSANLDKSIKQIYRDFQDLQASRVPFAIVTPKRVYTSMLMTSLSMITDKHTENALALTVNFQQVILVSVSAAQIPRINQKNPGSTGATQNAGKKSALKSLAEGIGSLFGK